MHNLKPKVEPKIRDFIPELPDLVSTYGSPLNVLFPDMLISNGERFNSIVTSYGIEGKVFYASKANKSAALLKAARKADLGADVASKGELVSALAAGFTGEDIEATGPKNSDFLTLCLLHGVLINMDSIGELERVVALHEDLALSKPTRIMLRLNQFSSSTKQFISKDSRFGIDDASLENGLKIISSNSKKLNLVGFSFHLATTSVDERVIAFETAYRSMIKAMEYGLDPKAIDIGGGFSISYLESKEDWQKYIASLKESVLNGDSSYTWDGNGIGFWNDRGTLRGQGRFPDFYREMDQFDELEALLKSNSIELGASVADLLRDSGFKLYIEPGRSLLDQAGLTACTVLDVKKSLKGENLIVVDMNRSNMNAQDLEYMSDPILLSKNIDEDEAMPCFIAGNLCLPFDFITKRKVWLPKTPSPGDILVFHNSAGYYMDFSESNTLKQKVAEKVAVDLETKKIYTDLNYPLI